jgi:hypothetical protein
MLRLGPANILGVIATLLVLCGTFGPWLSRSSEPSHTYDPSTFQVEVHYRYTAEISPLLLSLIEHGISRTDLWFYSVAMSLVAIGLVAGAILCTFSFGRFKISLIGWLLWFSSCLLFFLNLGGGLWLGVHTFFGWGFVATVIAGVLMFCSVLVDFLTQDFIVRARTEV